MGNFRSDKPLGTTDVKVLLGNASNFDEAMHEKILRYWLDRFGRQRLTWHGIEELFQEFLINAGYQDMGEYAAGLELTARNQIFRKDGELYRASAALGLPYTLSGDWVQEKDLFVAMGDQSLRQQLADTEDPDNGAAMIGLPSGGSVADLDPVIGPNGASVINFENGRPGSVSIGVDEKLDAAPAILGEFFGLTPREKLQNAFLSLNGKTLQLTSGQTYSLDSGIVHAGSLSIEATGPEPAVLYVPGNTSDILTINNPNPEIATTLNATQKRGGRDWVVADAAGIEPGMLMIVMSSESWYFDPRPETSDARKSELQLVSSVSGNTVTTHACANDSYYISLETVTLTFVRPIRVNLKNVLLKSDLAPASPSAPHSYGLTIKRAIHAQIENVSSEEIAHTGIFLEECYMPYVRGGYALRANQAETGYGVHTYGCYKPIVENFVSYQCRAAGDFSGGNIVTVGGEFRNCVAFGGGTNSLGQPFGWDSEGNYTGGQRGFGSHGAADKSTYADCHTEGMPLHYVLRGGDERIIRPKIYGRTQGGAIKLEDGAGFYLENAYADGGDVSKTTENQQNGNPLARRPSWLVDISDDWKGANRQFIIKGVRGRISQYIVRGNNVMPNFVRASDIDVEFQEFSSTNAVSIFIATGTVPGSGMYWHLNNVQGTGTDKLTMLNGVTPETIVSDGGKTISTILGINIARSFPVLYLGKSLSARMLVDSPGTPDCYGLVRAVQGSGGSGTIGTANNVNVLTGPLTGITGPQGSINVSVASGKIWVENTTQITNRMVAIRFMGF